MCGNFRISKGKPQCLLLEAHVLCTLKLYYVTILNEFSHFLQAEATGNGEDSVIHSGKILNGNTFGLTFASLVPEKASQSILEDAWDNGKSMTSLVDDTYIALADLIRPSEFWSDMDFALTSWRAR